MAATLAPVVSALAARAVALRWTTWPPAALVAGLAYGFSPYVLEGLTLEHIDWVTLAIPPLVLLCLDEILVTQRRRAWVAGASLGALGAVQFFLSPEVLVMVALAAGIGTAVLVLGALVVDRGTVGRRWRHAAVGMATAAVTAGALLAYPVWYALAGPRHLPGKVWPDQQLFGNSWQSVLLPAGPHDRGPNSILEAYGSFGPHPLLRGYLGIALACVLVAGLVRFRTEIRLWFLVSLLVIFEALALGASAGPWRLFENVPVVENVVPGRLPAVADLFAALALGLVVDRARARGRGAPLPGRPAALGRSRRGPRPRRRRPRAGRLVRRSAVDRAACRGAGVVHRRRQPSSALGRVADLPVPVVRAPGADDLAGARRPAVRGWSAAAESPWRRRPGRPPTSATTRRPPPTWRPSRMAGCRPLRRRPGSSTVCVGRWPIGG